MGLEREFWEIISGLEDRPVTPKDIAGSEAPPFHQRLAQLLIDYPPINEPYSLEKEFRRLLPLVDFLTQSRSVNEFQALRKSILEAVKQRDYPHYLFPLAIELRIFPKGILGHVEHEGLLPNEAMEFFQNPLLPFSDKAKDFFPPFLTSTCTFPPETKIVSLEKACQIIGAHQGLTSYTPGKFRDGGHSGQDKLLEAGKRVVGKTGLNIIHVEADRSIRLRRGPGHKALPQMERTRRIAARQYVDLVLFEEPQDHELESPQALSAHYDRVQAELSPDYWVIGTKDNPWRDIFTPKAEQLGAIFLWDRETDDVSASQMIRALTDP